MPWWQLTLAVAVTGVFAGALTATAWLIHQSPNEDSIDSAVAAAEILSRLEPEYNHHDPRKV
ncbi:hypothetical protein HLB23_28150 [Nocardia uniformis]|uniref:Uncharacterized protein n=1 Tax=Nocardia uniformis TaxID=53432 RepID=A0A849CEC8_9NOCA|nr:hypothetical protein [Nocardia uniformis]NNH73679.1 hypothetical protein [Nocardia uniformis]